MYTVSPNDRPHEISSTPQSSIGAPCPQLVVGEHSLRLAYYIEERRLSPQWSAAPIRPNEPGESDEICALVRFTRPYAHMFGPPNDEAFSGHPLAARGLGPYRVFEIENSSWVRSLERMNSVHSYHRPERFGSLKHFVFAFHDTTFECVAEAFDIVLCRGSPWSVLRRAENDD